MLWSGSKPLTIVRENMWGFLMFAGVAWLAISWSVLRLEPTDIVSVAGPVVLFGALTEGVRALAATKTWWLNAGMAVLFLATGIILMADGDSSYTTPAALLGWYLMVRGAADVAVSMLTRETDRIWGLLMVVGVAETGLGFFAASPLSRTADLVVTVLGALALMRGVADLVAALRLREMSPAPESRLELTAERADGVAGYSAGLNDFEAQPAARTGPRHRAASRPLYATGDSATAMADLATPGSGAGDETSAAFMMGGAAAGTSGFGPSGANSAGSATGAPHAGGTDPIHHEPGTDPIHQELGTGWAGPASAAAPTAADGPTTGTGWASDPAGTFHDEVVRTTADLDAMLALAGVTGAGVGLAATHQDVPEVPDNAEGAEEAAAAAYSPARHHRI